MTRAIKFRAWEEHGKNMISPEETGDHTLNDLTEVLPYILIQYTGLKDKNGKEIYEGDIVKVGENYEQIYWNSDYAQFSKGKTIGGVFTNIHEDSIKFEIIGNIYENPELIK